MPVQTKAFYDSPPDDPTKRIVRTGDEFEHLVRWLVGKPLIVDYETSGLAYYAHSNICGIALASWDEHGRLLNHYVPVRHKTAEPQFDIQRVGPAIQSLLADQYTLKIAHNIKFEDHMSRREGWSIRGPRFDTLIAARLYDENIPVALKTRARSDLGYTNAGEWESRLNAEVARLARVNKIPKRAYTDQHGYSEVNINLCGTYACWDTEFTGGLYKRYCKFGIEEHYAKIWTNEMKLTRVICDMEEEGLPLDVQYLVELRERAEGIKDRAERTIHSHLGSVMFSLGSDDELRFYLERVLRLPLFKKTRGQKFSVDRDVLTYFKDASPVLPLLMEWRDANKICTTYTTSLIDKVDRNNRLHCSFNQVGTNTGRLSAEKPNFQNMSNDDDDRADFYGVETDPLSVKRAFPVRAPGAPRFYFDYSQIELRVLAKYSMDPIMVAAFQAGEDLHDRTALEVFGSSEKKYRRLAKVINFGLSYCMTAVGFSRNAKIPKEEAEKYLDKFFQRYHGITSYREAFWAQAVQQGCQFNNLWGRTRRLKDLGSGADWERGRAQRQAIGTIVQGTAAELTRVSLVRTAEYLESIGSPMQIVNTVHDEIQFDTMDAGCIPTVVPELKRIMEDFPELHPLPVVVDCEITDTHWAAKRSFNSGDQYGKAA